MQTSVVYKAKSYQINLTEPLDISIPLRASFDNVRAWYLKSPEIEPVRSDNWVGSVAKGGSVNFNTINFNPHAHGTHTECVGHITEDLHHINDHLKQFFFLAKLITILPEIEGQDHLITKQQLSKEIGEDVVEAIAIRTLPNSNEKLSRHYSHTNPPYLSQDASQYLVDLGIKHLLIDLPSVDKEIDEGKLLAHNTFWNTSGEIRYDATITELIYVNESIEDGLYFLNLQIAPFENDASPSKPILYKIQD